MSNYLNEIEAVRAGLKGKTEWGAINPEYVVRMRQQTGSTGHRYCQVHRWHASGYGGL